jgi:hypothetical protein
MIYHFLVPMPVIYALLPRTTISPKLKVFYSLVLLIETLHFIHLYISLQEHSPLQKLKLLLLGTGIELDNETSSVIQRYYGDWLRGVETRRGAVNLVETAPRHYHQSTCENCQKPQCPVGWYFWPVRFNFR